MWTRTENFRASDIRDELRSLSIWIAHFRNRIAIQGRWTLDHYQCRRNCDFFGITQSARKVFSNESRFKQRKSRKLHERPRRLPAYCGISVESDTEAKNFCDPGKGLDRCATKNRFSSPTPYLGGIGKWRKGLLRKFQALQLRSIFFQTLFALFS